MIILFFRLEIDFYTFSYRKVQVLFEVYPIFQVIPFLLGPILQGIV